MLLVDNAEGSMFRRVVHDQLLDVRERFAHAPVLSDSAAWLSSRLGRRPHTPTVDDPERQVLVSPVPENALPDLAVTFRPDIVVGASLSPATWLSIRSTSRALHIPTALYLENSEAVEHLTPKPGQPFLRDDFCLGRTRALVREAERVGNRAFFLPEVIDVERSSTKSTLERVLLVDPTPENGIDLISDLAPHFSTVEFVLQEDRPLTSNDLQGVQQIIERHPNVCFRRRPSHRSEIFRDAAILLVPHRTDQRPRVAIEAMANAIPVIAADLPELRESLEPAAEIVDSVECWRDAIGRLWQDQAHFRAVRERSVEHARRMEISPESIADEFLSLMQDALARRRQQFIDLTID